MAKKASKAKTKKDTSDTKSQSSTSETSAAQSGKQNKKLHERVATKREGEQIEKDRKYAASYLTQRDGMDEDLARTVADSMSPEDINELITEANTGVLDRTKQSPTFQQPAQQGATLLDGDAEPEEEDDKEPYLNFLTVEQLAANEEFPELIQELVTASITKNKSEVDYKAKKVRVIKLLDDAGAKKIECFDVKLARYTGHNRQLSKIKLLEKGVSIDIINQCYGDSPYEDVRIYPPKAAKAK